MTKTELIESIRGIVREEVREQLPNLLVEILAERISAPTTRPVVTEQRRAAPVPAPRVAPKGADVLKNVKNPALRAVLSETVGGIPGENTAPMVSGELSLVSRAEIPKTLLSENAALAAVDGAMKKDYRGLLKAMDKKQRGPSNINFSAPPVPTSFEQESE